MDTRTRIAWNLRRLRIAKGLTQENLAVDAGVDRSVISDLERSRHNVSINLLDRLASALSVDISVFFVVPSADEQAARPLKVGRKAKS
ncbi:helix-turn-helix domain-containing protein [Allorhizobium sp. NPDC080224]|jgi:transcriptional regulator with XRE-family HTH domain|uniref:helix-turn-helix domain-containing protein n=1 Tax=Allorhizobium sp. NPDC080224 TaxID=3390547 RepID=UPI003D03E975